MTPDTPNDFFFNSCPIHVLPDTEFQNSGQIPARLAVAIILLPVTMATCPRSAAAVEADWLMHRDPVFQRPATEVRFPPGLPALWLQAIERPERDLKRRGASAIALAHSKGLTGLEVTIEPLMKILDQPDEDRTVRLTAARALVELDAREAAPLLFKSLQPGDVDFAELVEPALARWTHTAMREVWRARLAGQSTVRRMHVLAIRGLTALGDTESLPRLLQLAQDRGRATDVRLEAAMALGRLQETGLEEAARKLIGDKSPQAIVDRLVAARMLARHRGKDAESLLSELATDPQTSVRAIALEGLFGIDPNLILPMIDQTITSDAANVRRWGAKTLVAKPSPENLVLLGPMLDDPDPGLRRYVCDALLQLAQDESLHDAVVTQGRRILASDSWRGLEQATLLLVSLNDKSIVDRLLELLDAERAEVHATAAWGLCRLDVASTSEPICKVFRRKTDSYLAGEPRADGTELQLSHLAQALGQMKYAPADSVLRKYIPKGTPLPPISRAGAVWALGQLYADNPQDELANQLVERLNDVASMMPEASNVRAMSAVTLGA